jgi:hypothetical protein
VIGNVTGIRWKFGGIDINCIRAAATLDKNYEPESMQVLMTGVCQRSKRFYLFLREKKSARVKHTPML